ncbi:MAG: HD domain-containing protein [Deltaproteobacteria bacterium]|nr:HD domain-containing protein [Deltaproteobacteria bacterium]
MPRKCESEHELTFKLRKLTLVKLLNRVKSWGKIYLVGGAIRDLALGKTPKDYDFVVSDEKDIGSFEKILGRKSFVLGKKPNHAHRICSDLFTIDITILDGTIEDDLKRRDLTLNAMAYDLKDHTFVDILGGFKDLKSGILRFPSENVILSDPLRMLKTIRHFTYLKGFSLTDEVKMAIMRHRENIKVVPGERIKYELDLILGSHMAYEGFVMAKELGLLYEIFPEFYTLKSFDQETNLELKTLDHTLYGLRFLRKYNKVFKLKEKEFLCVGYALLFHDLGKPFTYTFDSNKKVVHFFGHEKVSMGLAESIMERLRFSHWEIRNVLELIKNHMWIFLLNKDTPTARATRRLIIKMGELTPSLVLLTLCDMFGTTEGRRNKVTRKIVRHLNEIMKTYREFIKEPPPKIVDGHDLLSIGYKEGPFLGEVLKEIKEKQLSSEIKTKEEALQYARNRLLNS